MTKKHKSYTFSEARLAAVWKAQYLGSALMSMYPIEKPDLTSGGQPTMAVDRWWRVYYNPAVFDNVPLGEAAAILIHEVKHLLDLHAKRRELKVGPDVTLSQGEALRWNIAADLPINECLREMGLNIPNGVFPDKIKGKNGKCLPSNQLAEDYYDMLEHKEIGNYAYVMVGSGADGIKRDHEEGPPQGAEGDGEKSDAPGVLPHEADVIAREVAKNIQRAKAAGNMPGSWQRWADELLNPTVDWKRELRSHVLRAIEYQRGLADFSYKRQNRRSVQGGPIMPGMIEPIVSIGCIIDVSGSMSPTDIAEGMTELQAIVRNQNAGIMAFSGDTHLQAAKKVFDAKQVELMGGGGTDMSVCIEQAAQWDKPPLDLIVVFTDGYTGWPATPPRQKVIACITSGGEESAPSWVRQIRIQKKGG